MSTFKAFRIHEAGGKISARFEDLTLDALTPGEVVIDVQYSDINYKDALAATGAGKILRRYPLVGGIDLAGVVKILRRCALQARRRGAGHGQRPVGKLRRRLCRARAREGRQRHFHARRDSTPSARWRSARRDSPRRSRFIAWSATARRRRADPSWSPAPRVASAASPSTCWPARGYEVIAVTGKAAVRRVPQVVRRQQRSCRAQTSRSAANRWSRRATRAPSTTSAARCSPGSRARWISGGISPASGLAGGAELKTTVMPFILRGVSLLGINSSATPRAERLEVWQRIATDLTPRHLERIAQPHDPVRRAARRVPGLHRRKSHRSHSSKDRRAAVNFRP